ncbi:MAG: uncharacterized membrane protein YjgN (DUF898 family) [Bacteriovoracaceae bacterium]
MLKLGTTFAILIIRASQGWEHQAAVFSYKEVKMTASALKLILLMFVLGLVSTGCANQNTTAKTNEAKEAKYPDENDYKGKLKVKAPKVSRDNYHAFLDSY